MDETWKKNNFIISTNKAKLNVESIFQFIKHSYWGKKRTLDQTIRAIEHSYCFGLYDKDKQIGFARVITDNATFAYLADVYVEDSHQQQGLGKWLIDTILNSDQLKNVRTWMLLTDDAHGLYKQFGFQAYAYPEKVMRLDKQI